MSSAYISTVRLFSLSIKSKKCTDVWITDGGARERDRSLLTFPELQSHSQPRREFGYASPWVLPVEYIGSGVLCPLEMMQLLAGD